MKKSKIKKHLVKTEEDVLHILDTLWDKLDIWYNEGYPTEFNLKDWFNKCELKKK